MKPVCFTRCSCRRVYLDGFFDLSVSRAAIRAKPNTIPELVNTASGQRISAAFFISLSSSTLKRTFIWSSRFPFSFRSISLIVLLLREESNVINATIRIIRINNRFRHCRRIGAKPSVTGEEYGSLGNACNHLVSDCACRNRSDVLQAKRQSGCLYKGQSDNNL